MKAKNKIYIVFAFFTLASFGLIAFFVYPSLRDIENGFGEILSYRSKGVLMSLQNTELDSFKKKHKDYELNLGKISKMFVDKKNPVDFIRFLESIALDSNVSINVNIVTLSKSKEKNPDNLPASFQIFAKGDFLDILKFSEKLETGRYLAKVKSLSLKEAREGSIGEKNPSKDKKEVEADFLVETIEI